MSDQQNSNTSTTSQPPLSQAWEDLGKQFQTLGESIADTFRTAWTNEDNRQHVQNMRGGLEAMITEIDKVIKETTVTPNAQRVKDELGKTAKVMQSTGEQTVEEFRPQVAKTLRQFSDQLEKLINTMEIKQPPETSTNNQPPTGTRKTSA
jgi:chaperonin cofactor prefoldin